TARSAITPETDFGLANDLNRPDLRSHITPPGALAYGRVDTAAALLRTIGTLNGLSPRPDLVVISGDIADSAQPEEYAHATKLLGALQMPFAAIPGNHDRRAPMREAFPDSLYGNAVRRVEGLDIFLMDSTVAGAAHGELDVETLVWLDGALAASATRPAFLFLHHPPFDTGISTRTRRGCGTPTGSPRFSIVIRACCWSRRGTRIVPRKRSSQAFRRASARPVSRR
ncbi:MAG: metallophosphoesterase, partial [Pseudolabrys sp.]